MHHFSGEREDTCLGSPGKEYHSNSSDCGIAETCRADRHPSDGCHDCETAASEEDPRERTTDGGADTRGRARQTDGCNVNAGKTDRPMDPAQCSTRTIGHLHAVAQEWCVFRQRARKTRGKGSRGSDSVNSRPGPAATQGSRFATARNPSSCELCSGWKASR